MNTCRKDGVYFDKFIHKGHKHNIVMHDLFWKVSPWNWNHLNVQPCFEKNRYIIIIMNHNQMLLTLLHQDRIAMYVRVDLFPQCLYAALHWFLHAN